MCPYLKNIIFKIVVSKVDTEVNYGSYLSDHTII